MALDTGRSGREDKREESRRVVGPTRDDGEDVHQHGTSGDCCESQVTKPDQLTDTHDDQWEREESAQDHLSGEEPQIVTGRRVLRSKHSRHGQGGRPVRELPHHIGCPQHDSRTQAQPGPSGGENRACPGDQQAEGKGDQQKEDQVLVLEAEAGHRSGAHPASGAFLDDGPEDQPERERPGGQVVDRGPGQVRRAEGDRSTRHGDRGQHLGEAFATQRGRREPGPDDDCAAGQSREHPHRARTGPEEPDPKARQPRGQGRLVHIAQGKVAATGDEVELVPMEAIAGTDRHLHRNKCGSDPPNASVERRRQPTASRGQTAVDLIERPAGLVDDTRHRSEVYRFRQTSSPLPIGTTSASTRGSESATSSTGWRVAPWLMALSATSRAPGTRRGTTVS